jgi:hypothetical protein
LLAANKNDSALTTTMLDGERNGKKRKKEVRELQTLEAFRRRVMMAKTFSSDIAAL